MATLTLCPPCWTGSTSDSLGFRRRNGLEPDFQPGLELDQHLLIRFGVEEAVDRT